VAELELKRFGDYQIIYADAVTRIRHLNRLAMLYGRFGRHDEARAALTAALEIDPDAVASRVNLANLSVAAENYAEARRYTAAGL
jgi:Flp pilus assembly protein TadD